MTAKRLEDVDGFNRKRIGTTGTPAWMALYRDARGTVRSAGSYPTRKRADKAWQHAEALLATGRSEEQRARRITFADYVTVHWFPPTPADRVVLIASATRRAAPRAEFADPLRNRVATTTGADDALDTVASRALSPSMPE